MDPNSQTWNWIESAIRDLGIGSILCDSKFAKELEENTTMKIRKVEIVQTSSLSISILYLKTVEHFKAPFSDLTYVVQTSGTSGVRKTVFVSERSIWPNVDDFIRIFELKECEKVFAASPPTFDPFYLDIFLSLAKLSTLIFVQSSIKSQSERLGKILFEDQRISYLQITPTLYKSLSNNLESIMVSDNINFVKYIVLGGEIFPNIPSSILSKTSTQIFNVYGVTEMSCWQTLVRVKSADSSGSQPICNIDPSSQILTETNIQILNKVHF
jgi:acyl-CoA synthetase